MDPRFIKPDKIDQNLRAALFKTYYYFLKLFSHTDNDYEKKLNNWLFPFAKTSNLKSYFGKNISNLIEERFVCVQIIKNIEKIQTESGKIVYAPISHQSVLLPSEVDLFSSKFSLVRSYPALVICESQENTIKRIAYSDHIKNNSKVDFHL